jgi:hypothetical protein
MDDNKPTLPMLASAERLRVEVGALITASIA